MQGRQWVIFYLDGGRYALPLSDVERVVRAAYVTPLPMAPDIVIGALDVQGQVLPVCSLRRRLKLADRAISPADHFLIVRTSRRTVVLVIDSAEGLLDLASVPSIDAQSIAPNLSHISGMIQLEDGLVLIQDLEQLLSPDEARTLDEAMSGRT